MPLPVCLGVVACSLCWMSYGIYVGDVFVTVPNALGAVLGMFQIGLHVVYRKVHTKPATDDYRLSEDKGAERLSGSRAESVAMMA